MSKTQRADCYCGFVIFTVPLPKELAALHGSPDLWVHASNKDIYCYDGDPDAQGAVATPLNEVRL